MNGAAPMVHETHRTRFSDASTFDGVCELCGTTDNPLGVRGEGQLGDLVNPCPASDEQREAYDLRASQHKMLSAAREIVKLDFVEVSGEMLPAFLDQISKCATTLQLDLIVCLTGSREYAGKVRHAVAVTIPNEQAGNTINVRRWFEDGTWS